MTRSIHCFVSTLLLFLFLAACSEKAEKPGAESGTEVMLGMGAMVGEVTDTTAHIQARLTKGDQLINRDLPGAAGTIQFSLEETDTKDFVAAKAIGGAEESDFISRASFTDLKPGTRYTCKISFKAFPVDGSLDPTEKKEGPAVTFKTLYGKGKKAASSFVVVTGMNYAKFHGDGRIDRAQHLLENNTDLPKPYAGPDKALGYPALEAILKLKPDFLVGTGDNVYYDTPDNPRAESVTELRQKWHEQFVQPRFRDLFAEVPTYWMIDDHDYRIDDGDNSGDYDPTPQLGREMMLEQLPLAATDDKDAKTYRTHRVSSSLQFWLPENRMYRSDNKVEDGPEKTIWGSEQKAWLKKTLLESDAEFKILISPTPMIGPDDLRKTDNHTNIGGFRHERDEFFAWLNETGIDKKNFYIICGDRHWQYQSVDSTGIEEFSCGALIDANSRLGRKPGDPASTDPDGLIKQPYYQDPRSGGFLKVEVKPGAGEEGSASTLSFIWHDEKGVALHTVTKQGPMPSQ